MDADDLEQAAHWHGRLIDAPEGPSRRAVEAAFHAWCRMREVHGVAYVAVTQLGAVAHDLADQPALADAVAMAHARAAHRRAHRRRLGIAVICGAVVITPVAALTIQHFVRSTSPVPVSAATRVYETKVGERRSITLDDSTRVQLDTASRLSVQGHALRVQGQAYVATGTTPVMVEMPGVSIRLSQGELNVRSDGARREIFAPGRGVVADIRGVGAPTAIPAGQVLRLDGERPRVAVASDPGSITSWRNGWLLFEDVPLARAAAEINRYRHVPIRLSPATRTMRISGSFRIDDRAGFLRAVAATLPATVATSAAGPVIVPADPAEK